MADEAGEETVSVPVSADLAEWLAEHVAESDSDQQELLDALTRSYRAVVDGDRPPSTGVDSEIEDRFQTQRDEYVDLIEDVRDRVIQVKREADQKASTDHTHPEIASRIDETDEQLRDLEAAFDDLEGRIDDLETDLENGFENFGDVVEHLTGELDGLRDNVDTLASAVVDLRTSVRRVASADSARQRTDQLKRAANQSGIRSAKCEDCGATVDIGLLAEPSCPHCSAGFVDVAAGSGFFGSDTLETGAAPALRSGVEADSDDVEQIVANGDDGGRPGDEPLDDVLDREAETEGENQ